MARAKMHEPSARKRVRPIIYSNTARGLPARHRAGRRVALTAVAWLAFIRAVSASSERLHVLGFFAPTLVHL